MTQARQAQRTPLTHCAASTLIWYVATIAASVLHSDPTEWRGGVLMGLAAWVLSSLLLWLVGERKRIQPWLLIALALPFYGAMWLATNLTIIAWALLYFV